MRVESKQLDKVVGQGAPRSKLADMARSGATTTRMMTTTTTTSKSTTSTTTTTMATSPVTAAVKPRESKPALEKHMTLAPSSCKDYSTLFKVCEGVQTEMSTGTDIHNMFLQLNALHEEFEDSKRLMRAELQAGLETRFQEMYATTTEKLQFVERQYQSNITRNRLAYQARLDSSMAQVLSQQKKKYQTVILQHEEREVEGQEQLAAMQALHKREIQRADDKVDKLQYVLRKAIIMLRLQGVKDLEGLDLLDDGAETRLGNYVEQLQSSNRKLEGEVQTLKHQLQEAQITRNLASDAAHSSPHASATPALAKTPVVKDSLKRRITEPTEVVPQQSQSAVSPTPTCSALENSMQQAIALTADSQISAPSQPCTVSVGDQSDTSRATSSATNHAVSTAPAGPMVPLEEHELELQALHLEHMQSLKLLRDETKAIHQYYKQILTDSEKKLGEMQTGYEMRLHAYQEVTKVFPKSAVAIGDRASLRNSAFSGPSKGLYGGLSVQELIASQDRMLHYASILFGDRPKRNVHTQTLFESESSDDKSGHFKETTSGETLDPDFKQAESSPLESSTSGELCRA